MDFDLLLEVVKGSNIATIRGQIIILQKLQENTDVDYSTQIAALETLITNITAL